MKCKYFLYIILIVVIGITIYGCIQKRSYTDISKNLLYLDSIYVAEIPEDIAIADCEYLKEFLPLSPIILKVKAIDNIEHLAGTSRQLVTIQEIYKGEGVLADQNIYITSSRWSLSLYSEPFSIERGFVNIMDVDEEYLIFIEKKVDGLGEITPVYKLIVEKNIAPIFSYREHENKVSAVDSMSTYVLYNQVRDNEFFGVSQEAINAFISLKTYMFDLYNSPR